RLQGAYTDKRDCLERAVSLPAGNRRKQRRAVVNNRRFPMSRRTLLRGAGVALGLPWLEAMAPAAPGKSRPPVRMAVLYMPNGVHPDMWTPEGEGSDFKLSPTLEPLSDLKNQIVVPTNLWNEATKGGEGHYVKVSGFLTCTTITKTQGVDLNCNGVSMDQVAARIAGSRTPLPPLELGISPVSTGVDINVGYTRVYGAHVAWSGPTTPLAREINPRFVFERLFRAGSPQAGSGKRDKLLLDSVLDDARSLRQDVGRSGRRRDEQCVPRVRRVPE